MVEDPPPRPRHGRGLYRVAHRCCLSRKVKTSVPFSKAWRPQHRYRSRHSWREAAPCLGRGQMLIHAGSPKALDFDSVDRCFAALAATGFVGFIAVVVCAWVG